MYLKDTAKDIEVDSLGFFSNIENSVKVVKDKHLVLIG